MARRTPQGRTPRHDIDDDGDGVTNMSIGDSDEDDDEDEDEDEDEGDDDDTDGDDGDDDDDDDSESDDDDSDEDDDEGEEEEEDDADEDEGDDDTDVLRDIAGDGTVPIARLNEVIARNRQLEAHIAAQQGGGGGAPAADDTPAFDVKAKIKERNAKLLEGDEDAAYAIDLEIEENRQIAANKAAADAAAATIEQQNLRQAIVDVQKQYDVLNDKKPGKFNRDLLDLVVAQRNVYIARGETMSVALRKAAKLVCEGRSGGGGSRQRKDEGDRNQMTLRQKREAMRRAKGQPPRPGKTGASGRSAAADLTEGDIKSMPERDFRNISARDKAIARGDFVEVRTKRTRRGAK